MSPYRAYKYLQRFMPSEKTSDLYDDDEMFADAINSLIPNFEYPDWSHKTVREVLAWVDRNRPA